MGRSPLKLAFFLIPLAIALAWFALSSASLAQLPPPAADGGYPNGNTAEGDQALFNLMPTYFGNTAIGDQALYSSTAAAHNTAIGYRALFSNTTGSFNTATGLTALYNNTTGSSNTADGWQALGGNTTGDQNTAIGYGALANGTGINNTAVGAGALADNTASNNTATGVEALFLNTTGGGNTASGYHWCWKRALGCFHCGEREAIGGGAATLSPDKNDSSPCFC